MSEPTIIIQARMGSTRFPGKIAADLCGQSVLERVIQKCWAVRGVRRTYIAAAPDPTGTIEAIVKKLNVGVIFGPEDDVLGRYILAARVFDADPIIRVTADCPLLNPRLCDDLLEMFNRGECSLASIGWPKTYPKGYGCEIFSRFTLDLANEFATDQYDREHVTPWMERNVRTQYLTQDRDESHINYCVDHPQDIERLERIILENKQ